MKDVLPAVGIRALICCYSLVFITASADFAEAARRDFVVILLAGHGRQQPNDNPEVDLELDRILSGLSEQSSECRYHFGFFDIT
jgi:hypothetical protein